MWEWQGDESATCCDCYGFIVGHFDCKCLAKYKDSEKYQSTKQKPDLKSINDELISDPNSTVSARTVGYIELLEDHAYLPFILETIYVNETGNDFEGVIMARNCAR